MRRLSLWLLALPLAVAGSEVAHSLAYRLVDPSGARRAHVLQETGHGYFRYAPLGVAVAASLVLLALAMRVSLACRRVPAGRLAVWFALVPALTFVLQEHLERLFADGAIPWSAALEPTFLPGLLLQIPLGLVAYLLVRLLLRGADRLGHTLAPVLRTTFWRPPAISRPGLVVAAPRIPVLALCSAGRAPPLVP